MGCNGNISTVNRCISIHISPNSSIIDIGQSQQYTATLQFSNGTSTVITTGITWNSSNPSVASINSNGLASVINSSGSTIITATYNGLTSNQASLKATNLPVASIYITPLNSIIDAGQTQQYNATAVYSDGTSSEITSGINWTSSNQSVASINSNGLATVISSSGTTNITAAYETINSNQAILAATSSNVVSISMSPFNARIGESGVLQYTAIATYSNGESSPITSGLTWYSLNPDVAEIDINGLAFANSSFDPKFPNSTTIDATYDSNIFSNQVPLEVSFELFDGSLAIAIESNYAYVTNQGNNSYTQCSIDSNDGSLIDCVNITPAEVLFSQPSGISVSNNFAYILNLQSNNYTQCQVESNGIESSSCITITPSNTGALNTPLSIAVESNYAYIINTSGNSYTQCQVGSNGIESSTCNTVVLPNETNSPSGIAIYKNYAYIISGSYKYTICNVGSNGIESATCESFEAK